jgi:hypothetical protein
MLVVTVTPTRLDVHTTLSASIQKPVARITVQVLE